MTGFVAEQCNITRVGFDGHHPEIINYHQVRPQDTLMHYLTPKAKYQIHTVVVSQLFLDPRYFKLTI